MRKLFTIMLSGISLIIMSQNKVSYFRRFYVDDRQYQLRALDKIEESIAKKTNCYRVFFDERNRVSKAEYLKRYKPDFDNYGFAGLKILYSNGVEKRYFLNPLKEPMKIVWEFIQLV